MTTQEIVLYTQHSHALQAAGDMAAIVEDNFSDGGGIAFKDLTRFKCGAGGSTAFTRVAMTPEGKVAEDPAKYIEAIVIERRAQRAYWPEEMGKGNRAPDCRSIDGRVGDGDNGNGKGKHDCAKCAKAQFGSSRKGAGKACREVRVFFLIAKDVDGIFPSVLMIPPASLGNLSRYAAALTNARKAFSKGVHRFELEKARSADGIDYAQVKASWVRDLAPEEVQETASYTEAMRPLLAKFYEQAVEEEIQGDDGEDTNVASAAHAKDDVPIGAETAEPAKGGAEIEPEFVVAGQQGGDSAVDRASAKPKKKGASGEMFPEEAHKDPA